MWLQVTIFLLKCVNACSGICVNQNCMIASSGYVFKCVIVCSGICINALMHVIVYALKRVILFSGIYVKVPDCLWGYMCLSAWLLITVLCRLITYNNNCMLNVLDCLNGIYMCKSVWLRVTVYKLQCVIACNNNVLKQWHMC